MIGLKELESGIVTSCNSQICCKQRPEIGHQQGKETIYPVQHYCLPGFGQLPRLCPNGNWMGGLPIRLWGLGGETRLTDAAQE